MFGSRSHALRRGRWSEAGRVYLVTVVTAGRIELFSDWCAASEVARLVSSRTAWKHSSLLCWVLMPDHWHGLIELGSEETLSRAVGRAKAHVSRSLNRRISLWAHGFHERAIRSHENLRNAARYIIANPVRAGLVRNVGEYSYWDAVWLEHT